MIRGGIGIPTGLLFAAGLIALIAAMFSLHRDRPSTLRAFHEVGRLHDQVADLHVPTIEIDDHVSVGDVQRDVGMVMRLFQLSTLLLFVPSVVLLACATQIGRRDASTCMLVAAVGGTMIYLVAPYATLSGMGIAWVIAATIAIGVGLHPFVIGVVRARRRRPR